MPDTAPSDRAAFDEVLAAIRADAKARSYAALDLYDAGELGRDQLLQQLDDIDGVAFDEALAAWEEAGRPMPEGGAGG